jgi:ArsR family metal-binding transcriptional regulator
LEHKTALSKDTTYLFIKDSNRGKRVLGTFRSKIKAPQTIQDTKIIAIGQDSLSRDPDDILSHFVNSNGRCKICGQDHCYTPTFKDVKTSIDVISELFGKNSKPKIVEEALKHA